MSEFMTDSTNAVDDKRLAELIAAKCNGVITEPEHIELESLLSQSNHARVEYWDAIAFHIDLEWELEGKEACEEVLAQVLTEGHIAMGEDRLESKSFSRSIGWISVLAASLVVSLLGGWIYWQSDRDDSQLQLAAVETVIGKMKPLVEGSRWSFGQQGKVNSQSVSQGDTISVDRGAVELRFASDTVAVLEAPLVMQVTSVDRVRVILGNIKVEVAEGAEGFVVETASAEVIDLGTVFAVNVKDGNTDLVVYDGQVDLKLAGTDAPNNTETVTKRFRAGEAVHVNDDGTLSRIVDVSRTNFDDGPETGSRVITAVEDNYVRDDFWSFYEIVPLGMDEDARAFADRPFHEWNGYTVQGMPPYLIGGDLVMTFNDDKVTEDLVIDVTLSEPATLYVLLDSRLIPPEWLLQSFHNTGDIIGLDEAPFYPDNPSHITRDAPSVGAGQGINRIFRIWKREVPNGGKVSLGPNGRRADDPQTLPLGEIKANMYGIVAVPLAN
jgi:ferric-dicitrate binding protein FerR (iron transport regulator)